MKRTLIALVGLVVALAGAAPANAHPGHTSCKTFGVGTADLAQGGTPPGAGPATAQIVAFFHGLECS